MFTPIAIVCLMSNPVDCNTLTGPRQETEQQCMNVQAEAVVELNKIPAIYIAALACVETHLLDQAASGQ